MLTKAFKNLVKPFWLVLVLALFSSCKNNAQKEQIIHQVKSTDLPFQFEINNAYEERDSSYVYLYIPQELKLENGFNNTIKIQRVYWSDKGGNTSKANVLSYANNTLQSMPYPIEIRSNDDTELKTYTRFKMVISNEEVEQLEVIFEQHFGERIKYEVGFTEKLRGFLNNKLPLKGYLRFVLYNSETKKRFNHNVPFEF